VSSKVQINYAEVEYQEGDSFLFGPETRGLPQAILDRFKGINDDTTAPHNCWHSVLMKTT
jgi:tRNA(Leu) C34 or U34 (ribose-2'-O)-methylase TrmL